LQFLEYKSSGFGSSFMSSPLTQMASMRRDPTRVLDIETGLVGILQELRSYFVDHQVCHLPLIDRVVQFFDRTLESIDEVRRGNALSTDIVDSILRTCHAAGNKPFDMVESIRMLLYTVDAKYPFFKQPVLDKAAYWRLQIEGFIFIMKVLTDLKHLMRQFDQELRPMWGDLRKSIKCRRPNAQFIYHSRESVLLGPDQSYSLILRLRRNRAQECRISDIRVKIFQPPKGDNKTPQEIKLLSEMFKKLEKFRVKQSDFEDSDSQYAWSACD